MFGRFGGAFWGGRLGNVVLIVANSCLIQGYHILLPSPFIILNLDVGFHTHGNRGAVCKPSKACAPIAYPLTGSRLVGRRVGLFRPGKDALLFDNRAHALTVVAFVVVPVYSDRIEQAAGQVRVRRALRGRPIVADRVDIVEARAAALARSRQEDTLAFLLPGEPTAIDAVDGRPFVGAVVSQFVLLLT